MKGIGSIGLGEEDKLRTTLGAESGGCIPGLTLSPFVDIRIEADTYESKCLINLQVIEASDLREAMSLRSGAVFILFRRARIRSCLGQTPERAADNR